MKKLLSLILLTALLCNFCIVSYAEPLPIYIYVSTEGNDLSDGTFEHPFLTIERAMEKVRAINKDMKSDIYVVFRGGEYFFDKSVTFSGADSSTGGFKIHYCSYEGENVIFSGRKIIQSKPEVWKDGIYRWYVGKDVFFRQLFVDGVKKVRARYPNKGEFLTVSKNPPDYSVVALDDSLKNYLNVGKADIEYNGLMAWRHSKIKIDEILNLDGTIYGNIKKYSQKVLQLYPNQRVNKSGQSYWLENCLAFLDAANEWFLDKETGYLYYYPNSCENVNSVEVSYTDLDTLIFLNGTNDNPVSGISFENIDFMHTGWAEGEKGYYDSLLTMFPDSIPKLDQEDTLNSGYYGSLYDKGQREYLPAALKGEFANDCSISDCTFYALGAGAAVFGRGCKNLNFTGNVFEDIGGNGIVVGKDYMSYKKINYPKNICIKNNLFYNIANEYQANAAVAIFYCYNLEIENNTFDNVYYSAIATNWGDYTETNTPPSGNYSIKYNKITNPNMSIKCYDGAAIYNNGKLEGKNIIEGNYVKGSSMHYSCGFGIYHDGCNRNWIIKNNVVEGYGINPIYWQSIPGQYATHLYAENNHITPLPQKLYGMTQQHIQWFKDKNLFAQNTYFYESAHTFSDDVKSIIKNSGLSEQYRHLEEKLHKRYSGASFGDVSKVYKFKYGIQSTIKGVLSNFTDTPENVQIKTVVKYKDGSPGQVQINEISLPPMTENFEFEIPITLNTANTNARGGTISMCAYFKNGDVVSIGQFDGYKFYADGVDTIRVGTDTEGFSKTGVWNYDTPSDSFGLTGYSAVQTDFASCTYTPRFVKGGKYEVLLSRLQLWNSETEAKYYIHHANGVDEVTVNHTEGTLGDLVSLGTYEFNQDGGYVEYIRGNNYAYGIKVGRASSVLFVRKNNTQKDLEELYNYYDSLDASAPKLDGAIIDVNYANVYSQYGIVTLPMNTSKGFGNTITSDDIQFKISYKAALEEGSYEVLVYRNISRSNASEMIATIMGTDVSKTVEYSLQEGNDGWYSLGTYYFKGDRDAVVWLQKELSSDGFAVYDSLKFKKVK